jgi:hypothetical protein
VSERERENEKNGWKYIQGKGLKVVQGEEKDWMRIRNWIKWPRGLQ